MPFSVSRIALPYFLCTRAIKNFTFRCQQLMLTAPLLRRRIVVSDWRRCAQKVHYYSGSGNGGRSGRRGRKDGARPEVKSSDNAQEDVIEAEEKEEPSLFEQLFPDQQETDQPKANRELPRIHLEKTDRPYESRHLKIRRVDTNEDEMPLSRSAERLETEMRKQGPETSVLVLRNASKNLVEEDFRRLVPQGQHLEGWKLEQGDILKVVPGRDLATLEQKNFYYVLFSSPLGAFTYQGHATRIKRMVAAHTPASMLSPVPPPPGYMIQGMDAHDAIESFSLVPPNQNLDLRQLKPPLTPMMESIVRYGGHPAVVERADRMPYEARLTLEGPQLHLSALRHIFQVSGRDRKLSWSGSDEVAPRLTKWEPLLSHEAPSPMNNKPSAMAWADKQAKTEDEQMAIDVSNLAQQADSSNRHEDTEDGNGRVNGGDRKRRTPTSVYIVGFHTERAMHSFVYFWHRRPMEWEGFKRSGSEDADLAPVANVEVLW